MENMSGKLFGEYYVGLDIGTDSVGWAVTDENYQIVKAKGKSLWGIRLIDGADTAVERRTFRSTRRRLERRRQRIALLQELFAKEISKKDEDFFQRLKDSQLFEEDKKARQPYTLFADEHFTDREYHQLYPTIYHLRKALIDGEELEDVRLLYIALHHIIKNRGHFIFEGTVEAALSFTTVFDKFINVMKEEYEVEIPISAQEAVIKVLKNKEIKKEQKKSKLLELFGLSKKDKQFVAIVGLLVGNASKLSEVFMDATLEDLEKNKASFADGAYEDAYAALEEAIPEKAYILTIFKAIYDWTILADLLKDEASPEGIAEYLSYAKVNQYNKHKKDLANLKKVIRSIGRDTYYQMFINVDESTNYCAYVGTSKVKGKKTSVKRCNKEDFYAYVKNVLKKATVTSAEDEKMIESIIKEIEEETFLPLQVNKGNGVIPHQIHLVELEKILDQAEKKYAFLSERDENGISVKEKIRSLFLFKIPYYVGPLNDYHKEKGGNSWIVKRESIPITPWNFSKVVDIDASAEQFIKRMTNKCTYLVGEDVLPKNSLMYCEFMVLNELNNVKVKGELLPVSMKQLVFEKLFKKEKSVTRTKLYKCLKAEGYELVPEDITGIEDKFLASLQTYIYFNEKVFKGKMNEHRYILIAEEVINYCTLYGEDKKMLKRVVKNHFGEALSEEQIKAICSLRCTGWGRLSGKFLKGVQAVDIESGECFTIIGALKETQDNLMQLLSSRYTFMEEIEKQNVQVQSEITEITYDKLIQDLALSPVIKRVTWQTISILEELKKVLGKPPKKVFIEVAKEKKEKVRTMSRKDQLIKLYANCKDEEREWKKELETKSESDFRSIKLYLYYTQKGKCMYTGEDIKLSELADTNIYDRDHIYARSKTKDDSLDNLVLVKKIENSKKSNDLINPEIQHKMQPFWQSLRKAGFISQEKYNRLMRKTPLTPEELAGFINRQLVETRQSTKIIAALVKQTSPESEVVYVKANLVSDFRKNEIDGVKCRTINDYHHAKDAYLNIVVGNVYHTKFTSNPLMWLKKNATPEYSLNKMFEKDLFKGGQCIWKSGNEGTKTVVKGVLAKNNILYTRYAMCNKGAFFDQQIISPKKNPKVPIKLGMDMSKYGGYSGIVPAYFALVQSIDKHGKLQRTIESVPLYLEKDFKERPEAFIKYCEREYKLVSPQVILPCIKKNALLKINGFLMHLRGTTGTTGTQLTLQGAIQLCLNPEEERYVKKLEKYLARNLERTDKKANLSITEYDGLTEEENLKLYDRLVEKHEKTIYQYRPASQVKKLKDKRAVFENLCVEEQCIVLGEIFHLFQCKPISANLSLVGGGGSAGSIKINRNISNTKSAHLIYQSVTGLYEKEIDLLRI